MLTGLLIVLALLLVVAGAQLFLTRRQNYDSLTNSIQEVLDEEA